MVSRPRTGAGALCSRAPTGPRAWFGAAESGRAIDAIQHRGGNSPLGVTRIRTDYSHAVTFADSDGNREIPNSRQCAENCSPATDFNLQEVAQTSSDRWITWRYWSVPFSRESMP